MTGGYDVNDGGMSLLNWEAKNVLMTDCKYDPHVLVDVAV